MIGGKTVLAIGAVIFCTCAVAEGSDPATQPAGPPPVAPADSILSEYNPQAPPNPNPPPYTLLRFNEDYSYLANPANRTDPFDTLKYIPLNPNDPASYLSFGGDIRERFEDYNAPGFGVPGQPARDDYLLQRITLYTDLHFNEHVRVFVQGISGLQFGGNVPPTPVNEGPVNLQQAFADYRIDNKAATKPEYLVVRGGRFEMSLGAGRLVATRAAPNIPFKFDGLQLIGVADDAKVYAFVTKPAREQKYTFDDEYPGQLFWGVYGTTPTLNRTLNLKADLYYLGLKNDQAVYANDSGVEERHTVGTRLFGHANGWDYDVEPIFQFGRLNERKILAWTVGSSEGYTFATEWRPRLGVDADIASGDTGHNGGGTLGTFNPLFFKAGYFNDASLVRPSNIIDLHPNLELHPSDNVLLTAGSDVLWRYTTNDGIYGPPGNLELPAGVGPSYFATTGEFSAQWEIDRHLSWIISYVHFFTGDYVATAHGRDVDFFGTWLTFTF
jgi:Alginate export